MTIQNHKKLGYYHMLEMREIENDLREQGVTGVALHFEAVRLYEIAHKNDLTYRERQTKWLATQIASTKNDLFRKALEEIRDGHNDPRALARLVLGGNNVPAT